MNPLNPVEQKSYDFIDNKISLVTKKVTEEKHEKGNCRKFSSTDNLLTVRCDGPGRRHSSAIGVCTVIGAETGKVLDGVVFILQGMQQL
ncbi:hypothetical protein TNCV_2511251 [Trichonephila clavipes]|nr:hypothetical protein TNCV_2511251 [Trichonephila clavipes]